MWKHTHTVATEAKHIQEQNLSYQFLRTRVVMRAAITMIRDTVMVMIWCTARPETEKTGDVYSVYTCVCVCVRERVRMSMLYSSLLFSAVWSPIWHSSSGFVGLLGELECYVLYWAPPYTLLSSDWVSRGFVFHLADTAAEQKRTLPLHPWLLGIRLGGKV